MTLSEVYSSSVNSTCVDVSLPFLNEPDTIDSSNEQFQSPDPDTQKTFEFDEDSDKNEVCDPEQNMIQILIHPESSQQSAPDGCDLHRAPSCLPDIDDGDITSLSSKESSCSEPNSSSQAREDTMDEWQISEDDEKSDTTDFGLVNEKNQGAAIHPSDKPNDTDSCIQCEVYTMTFGGVYAYTCTATPSPEIDDNSRPEEDKLDLKQSDQDVGVQLASKTSGTPCEVYTIKFGGLYTFSATTSDDATELEEQPNQTGQQLSEREESSLADGMEDKTDKQSEPTTPYEVYTVNFGGLHTFTATPSVSDRNVNNSEALSATSKTAELEANSSQLPMEIQEQGEVDKDCNQMTDKHAISTPYEVHTVTFGGLYTFTATLPPIQCDGAPPMHAT